MENINNNDKIMYWIRNIENLEKSNSESYYYEYELASECYIPGILDYQVKTILCSLTQFDKDKNGLYHYILKIRYAGFEKPIQKIKDKKEYFFKGNILGEICAIFSIYFQCRFYLIASYSELNHGIKYKVENSFVYHSCNPLIHPPIFSNKNKNLGKGLNDFLESIKLLNPEYHQQFILACYHYERALKEIGIDAEMIFIRLVSSIEALSESFELNKEDDLFNNKNFEEIVKIDILKDEAKELKEIFENRKSIKKFKRFIEKYSRNFFKGGRYRSRQTKINKEDLPKILSNIYNARSSYLHVGKSMVLSVPDRYSYKLGWDITHRDINQIYTVLPYPYFFEKLVRHCLLNFLNENKLN